jgi:hypothetical protein
MEITLTGLFTPPAPENRPIAYLDVNYNDNVYKWQIYVPPEVSLQQYIESSADRIKAEIDAKEAEWESAPKTRTYDDPFEHQLIFDVQKEEIVKPEIPDYYAKRRNEYPPLSDQIGALLKGADSPDYAEILAEVAAVKAKYPKP